MWTTLTALPRNNLTLLLIAFAMTNTAVTISVWQIEATYWWLSTFYFVFLALSYCECFVIKMLEKRWLDSQQLRQFWFPPDSLHTFFIMKLLVLILVSFALIFYFLCIAKTGISISSWISHGSWLCWSHSPGVWDHHECQGSSTETWDSCSHGQSDHQPFEDESGDYRR